MKLYFTLLLAFTTITFTVATYQVGQTEWNERFLADIDITMTTLAEHNTYDTGLWVALNGIVYDVTTFTHPGGSKILAVGGIDGTNLYTATYDKGVHPYTIDQVVGMFPTIVRMGPLVQESATVTNSVVPVSVPTDSSASIIPTAHRPAPVVAPIVAPLVPPVVPPFAAPMVSPTAAPVVAPVVPPFAAPVVSPVVAPVVPPFAAPVVSPTTTPVVSPTAAPMVAPTSDSPVSSASESPVMNTPVIAPYVSPFVAPSMTEPPVVAPTRSGTPAVDPSVTVAPVSTEISGLQRTQVTPTRREWNR